MQERIIILCILLEEKIAAWPRFMVLRISESPNLGDTHFLAHRSCTTRPLIAKTAMNRAQLVKAHDDSSRLMGGTIA
jgi:hypothetical protein